MEPALFRILYSRDQPPSREDWERLYDSVDKLFHDFASLKLSVDRKLNKAPWLYFARVRTALQRTTCPMCGSHAWRPHDKNCTLWNIWKEMDRWHLAQKRK